MPVAFNEPLSFLQRITEYMEHVFLVQRASSQAQPLDRMQVGHCAGSACSHAGLSLLPSAGAEVVAGFTWLLSVSFP